MRDGDDRCPCSPRGSARATRRTRRRGGSSARRAAADRARRAAGGRARRAAARRRRASRRRGRLRAARSASIAWSRCWSSCHASARSIASCTFACSASSASKSASGSANAAEISLKRSSRSRSSRTPSSTLPRTSFARVEHGLLLEEADARPRRELGDAGRRLLHAGHDPQQRRLAGPVRAEHADLRAREERQGDVRQHLALRAVELVDPVHRVDVFAAHRDGDCTECPFKALMHLLDRPALPWSA